MSFRTEKLILKQHESSSLALWKNFFNLFCPLSLTLSHWVSNLILIFINDSQNISFSHIKNIDNLHTAPKSLIKR